MGTTGLIWLHEYALSPPTDHLNKQELHDCRFIHVWDDSHLRNKEYSLKRLAFIYQSLLETPADIIAGPTFDTLQAQPESHIYIPACIDLFIRHTAAQLASAGKTVTWLPTPAFANLRQGKPIARFFQYWKKIERSAFMPDGGL